MKIIDLLNKIANGEEIPKRIKYNNIDYFWCNQCKIYERFEDDSKDLYNDLDNLNDEVEIIEEEKKIPERVLNAEVFDVPKLNNMELSNIALTNKEDIKIIKDTLNEVLDYLKSKGAYEDE